jgi:hypothetical protein
VQRQITLRVSPHSSPEVPIITDPRAASGSPAPLGGEETKRHVGSVGFTGVCVGIMPGVFICPAASSCCGQVWRVGARDCTGCKLARRRRWSTEPGVPAGQRKRARSREIVSLSALRADRRDQRDGAAGVSAWPVFKALPRSDSRQTQGYGQGRGSHSIHATLSTIGVSEAGGRRRREV